MTFLMQKVLREGFDDRGGGFSRPASGFMVWRNMQHGRPTMTKVTDNAALSRYEMVVDGVTAFVTYARQDGRITLIHTEVPKALGGRGIGSALASGVLEDIRAQGLRVVPECEFMAAFIKRHTEFSNLVVAESER
jgi:predicted GNAT family acetyltransferase